MELLRQNLDGDLAAQVGILGTIHFSHAALADAVALISRGGVGVMAVTALLLW